MSESIERVTDDELVAKARAGDADSFDQLVVRHQAAVFRAALAALRHVHDAEEAAQDTFIRAWSRLDRFRGDSSFKTWLLTIAWNTALSRRRSVGQWWKRRAELDDANEIARSAPGPEVEVGDRELTQHVRRAIHVLPPKLRDALLLAQSGEYEYAEIAAMLDVATGTVKWRVSEARKQVRARLQELGYVPRT
jgi:RNA polymerase sigma-70 factor (ECF subfamily)